MPAVINLSQKEKLINDFFSKLAMRKTYHCIRYTILLAVCLPLLFFVEDSMLRNFLFFVCTAAVFMFVITLIVPDTSTSIY